MEKNYTNSHLNYYLSKQFNEFMVSVTSFKHSSIQHDVQFVNCGSIVSKIDSVCLWQGYCVIDKSFSGSESVQCNTQGSQKSDKTVKLFRKIF